MCIVHRVFCVPTAIKYVDFSFSIVSQIGLFKCVVRFECAVCHAIAIIRFLWRKKNIVLLGGHMTIPMNLCVFAGRLHPRHTHTSHMAQNLLTNIAIVCTSRWCTKNICLFKAIKLNRRLEWVFVQILWFLFFNKSNW